MAKNFQSDKTPQAEGKTPQAERDRAEHITERERRAEGGEGGPEHLIDHGVCPKRPARGIDGEGL